MASTRGTILVVDDNADVREMMIAVLDEEGYPVEVAADGAEAVALLERYVPPPPHLCLVLLDMMLPQVDGMSVLRYLATLDAYVPVVAMSASMRHLAMAREAGAQGTLPKPFDIDQLLTIVRRNC